MKTLPLSEAKSRLSAIVKRVHDLDEEVTITVNGWPTAVIISQDNYEGWKETQFIKSNPEFYKQILRNMKALKAGKGRFYTMEEIFGK